jgi:pyridoxine 5-phosphate synthase
MAVTTKLSVNLNKVALVRNARGAELPDVVAAARVAIGAGCSGLTLHPRADARHATFEDVRRLAALDEVVAGRIELNIEGDLRPDLMQLVQEVRPTQFTMVPVVPGEITTTHGWRAREDAVKLCEAIEFVGSGIRISMFVDPERDAIELAAEVAADAVELHTFDYAAAYGTPAEAATTERYAQAARVARALGLRVHAGHDLNLTNLGTLLARLQPDEVSIGHALISEALMTGLPGVTRRYVEVIATHARTS